MTRPPLRLLLPLLCWLLIGAGITVGVTWACAYLPVPTPESAIGDFGVHLRAPPKKFYRGGEGSWWAGEMDSTFACTYVRQRSCGTGGLPSAWVPLKDGYINNVPPSWCTSATHPKPSELTPGNSLTVDDVAFGWPARSLLFRNWSDSDYRLKARARRTEDATSLWWARSVLPQPLAATSLPLRPLWPGFALNTLLYATLAWGLWHVPHFLRRRHRRARHRCTRCDYSLAGLAAGSPCPECGQNSFSPPTTIATPTP